MKNQAWQYANKKILLKLIAVSFAQQSSVALSTGALVKAGFSYENPQRFLFWCALSFGFHVLGPALQILIKAWEYDLSFEAYRSFLQKNLLDKSGTPGLWRRKDIKEIFISSVGIDAEGYLAAMLFVGLDIFTFLTSLVLGMIVLGSMIDVNFIPVFIISGILSYFVYTKISPKVKASYEQEQQARTDFNSYILTCWDNLFFKNQRIIRKYEINFEQKYQLAKVTTRKAATSAEFLVFILGIVSALPVLGLVLWTAHLHSAPSQTAILIGLMATIPRQLNMLTTFRSIFQNMAAYMGFESKFRVIQQNAEFSASQYLEQIRLPKITLAENQYESLNSMSQFLRTKQNGRYELRGENGSGKSTLLLHLNDALENSFYLPSHPNLAIADKELLSSSGEKMLQHIEFLSQGAEKYILLDEWDANLDANNRMQLEEAIEILARTKVIVEARHKVVNKLSLA